MNDAGIIKVDLKPGRYVVAVSGGVDSIALLHMIKDAPGVELIVAHVNHGIRPQEHGDKDSKLVEDLCKKWGLVFRSKDLNLGPGTSEQEARKQRESFLWGLQDDNQYDQIITAHHRDDVIETMIINLLRGTGRLGLSSMRPDTYKYLRPLLEYSKQNLIDYAIQNNLEWNEDITNQDTDYLRNYVRLKLLPKMKSQNPSVCDEYFAIYKTMLPLNDILDLYLSQLVESFSHEDETGITYDRSKFIMLPMEVSLESLHYIFQCIHIVEANKKLLARARNFIHTAKPGKIMNLDKYRNLICDSATFRVVHTETESPYLS